MKQKTKKIGSFFFSMIIIVTLSFTSVFAFDAEELPDNAIVIGEAQENLFDEAVLEDEGLDIPVELIAEAVTGEDIVPAEEPIIIPDIRIELPNIAEENPQVATVDQDNLTKVVNGLPQNMDQLDPENMLRTNSMTRAAAGDGFYGVYKGYMQYENNAQYVPVTVQPGNVLQAQLDFPAISTLDYDLYLCQFDNSGNIIVLTGSELHGNVSKTAALKNTSTTAKDYAVFAVAGKGYSLTQAFTLYIGVNESTDPSEPADANISGASNVTLSYNGDATINTHAMDTKCDSDWIKFTVPSSRSYSDLLFSLDSASIAAGYKYDIYSYQSNLISRVANENTFALPIQTGTYYARIYSTGCSYLTGANYTFKIASVATNVGRINVTELLGGSYVTYTDGYGFRLQGGYPLRVKGNVKDTSGNPLPNAIVTLYVLDDSWNPPELKNSYGYILSDAQGNFDGTVNVNPAVGNRGWDNGHSYVVGDLGKFIAFSGDVTSAPTILYIVAYYM